VDTTQSNHAGKPQRAALLDQVPPPEEIRVRLADCIREAAMLRSLLRVAERVKQQRRGPREVCRVG
jgi:replicative DNA helicase